MTNGSEPDRPLTVSTNRGYAAMIRFTRLRRGVDIDNKPFLTPLHHLKSSSSFARSL
jgi:hypothetical protein